LTNAVRALTYHLARRQAKREPLNRNGNHAEVARSRSHHMDVTVTERAAQRIGEILRREPPGTMLRVSVEGGGCSGFQYKFDIERAQAADDVVIERDGATVLIDQVSLGYLAGSEIDFVDDLIGASFRVNNPQATASCGCGTSFTV
jgi:iron-sulfur cluster assembly accessory protein